MSDDQKIPEGWNPLGRWAAIMPRKRPQQAAPSPQAQPVWTPDQAAQIQDAIKRWQKEALRMNLLHWK